MKSMSIQPTRISNSAGLPKPTVGRFPSIEDIGKSLDKLIIPKNITEIIKENFRFDGIDDLHRKLPFNLSNRFSETTSGKGFNLSAIGGQRFSLPPIQDHAAQIVALTSRDLGREGDVLKVAGDGFTRSLSHLYGRISVQGEHNGVQIYLATGVRYRIGEEHTKVLLGVERARFGRVTCRIIASGFAAYHMERNIFNGEEVLVLTAARGGAHKRYKLTAGEPLVPVKSPTAELSHEYARLLDNMQNNWKDYSLGTNNYHPLRQL